MAAIVVVGDLDTGVNYAAPELYQHVWINQGEIPKVLHVNDVDGDLVITFKDLNNPDNATVVTDVNKNGYIDGGDLIKDPRWTNDVDEDGNGKKDDLIGWNFVKNNNDPLDVNGHGTPATSIISSSGGASTYIVPIQLIQGRLSARSFAECVNYFSDLYRSAKLRGGAEKYVAINNPVVSNVSDWFNSMAAVAKAARNNILFIAAAGNNPALNNDLYPRFPSNFSSYQSAPYDNVISVTALDETGALSGDYGPYAVDIAAPGSATSWSVSYTTGAVAAFASSNAKATAQEIKMRLFSTSVLVPAMIGKTVTAGKLDQSRLLDPTTVLSSSTIGGTYFGTDASDVIVAGENDDLIIGHLNLLSEEHDTNEIDTITGGGGNDLFVLGNYDSAFYVNGGEADYAVITDFATGDKIGLSGKRSDYDLRDGISTDRGSGVGIFLKNTNDLVAIIEGRLAAQMRNTDFETVR